MSDTQTADDYAKHNFIFCEVIAERYGKEKVPAILRELADIYERTILKGETNDI